MNSHTRRTIQDLAQAYCEKYSTLERANDMTDFRLFEETSDLVKNDPDAALVFILKALAEKPGEFALVNLAAGPLEDLLVFHGEKVIAKVEEEARGNSDFDDLLGGVWLGRMNASVAERVARVRSGVWKE